MEEERLLFYIQEQRGNRGWVHLACVMATGGGGVTYLLINNQVKAVGSCRIEVVLKGDWTIVCVYHMARLWN